MEREGKRGHQDASEKVCLVLYQKLYFVLGKYNKMSISHEIIPNHHYFSLIYVLLLWKVLCTAHCENQECIITILRVRLHTLQISASEEMAVSACKISLTSEMFAGLFCSTAVPRIMWFISTFTFLLVSNFFLLFPFLFVFLNLKLGLKGNIIHLIIVNQTIHIVAGYFFLLLVSPTSFFSQAQPYVFQLFSSSE